LAIFTDTKKQEHPSKESEFSPSSVQVEEEKEEEVLQQLQLQLDKLTD